MEERDAAERGLPTGLTADIAALAAVMTEHGLEKIRIDASGIHVTLVAPRSALNGAAASPQAYVAAEAAEPTQTTPNGNASGYVVASPMIGTFYAAPSPTEEPFVRVGDLVAAGQTIGIIEAMKIMNEIQADRGGVVEEILVSNGQPVEYNQPLMRLTQ